MTQGPSPEQGVRRDAHAPPDAQVFVVGGAVRDELLGLAVRDRDWVVVGTTPQAMLDAGFLAVGRDFPVFLHPQTHEEYALARSERKTGPGYRGFSVHAAPEVTLEQDLARRDLTINAIARAADGTLIDPYGGRRDIAAGVLRHVSPAFAEDPVRILRVARFAARFTRFTVAPETMALMRQMVDSGEVDALVPERVWQEFARGLMEQRPSRMFEVLRDCGALARLLPEVARLWGVPPRAEHHPEADTGAAAATHARDTAPGSAAAVIASGLRSPEGAPLTTCGSAAADDPADARPGSAAAVIASGLRSPEGAPLTTCGDHLMMRLNMSAQLDAPLTVRYACLGHDLGKGMTPADALPRHIGHEQHSVALLRGVNERLRVPTDCAELAEVVAREHGNVHRSGEFGAAALLRLLERCDAFRKPARFREVLLACECDARGRLGFENTVYEPAPRLAAALTAAQALDTGQVAAAAAARGERGPAVGAAIQRERIAAVAAALVVPIGPDWTE